MEIYKPMEAFRQNKMLPVYIGVIIFMTVSLWILGYGLPVTIAAVPTFVIMKLTAQSLYVLSKELELRRKIADNDAENLKEQLKTIREFDRVAFEFHRVTSDIDNYASVAKMYFTVKRTRAFVLRLIAGAAVIGALIISFSEAAVNVPETIFAVAATAVVLASLVFCFRKIDLSDSEVFSKRHMKTMDYGSLDNIPFNETGADITLNAVHYRYPETEKDAIGGITLNIYAGERFGIVGRSDSGKTTLINLIKRKADATEGLVLINGAVIKDLTETALGDIFEKRINVFDGVPAIINAEDERTIIIASNRIRDMALCERIAVIDGGVIIAVGKHDELMLNCPLYKEMYTAENQTDDKKEDDFSDILEKTER
ncbi:MAG: ABC transporter ATP-binding protein/permease [Ruminococcus sp.]|jgi:ABC-type multidrug transport system fused ATPase/permease subunit|nr:ABC transporter ATP-binding protein/permease [Ruminococcus sp.]